MTAGTQQRGLVLVVEDEPAIGDLVRIYLTRDGFGVHLERDGAAGLAAARRLRPVACVLDIALPGLAGTEVCRRLREAGDWTPVIFLTARDDEVDRIVGLELGADDYLPKPFNPRELVARINAVLRRRSAPPPPGAPATEEEIVRFGTVAINLATRELTRNGTTTALTTGEFALLKILVTHPRQPMSRDKLMELARGREYDVFDRSIDVRISRLRKLVEDDPAKPRHIQTVWGFGYVFVPDGKKIE